MIRRQFLKVLGSLPLTSAIGAMTGASARPGKSTGKPTFRRVRPSDPQWPAATKWQELKTALKGELIEATSPLKTCADSSVGGDATCAQLFKDLKNPYFIGDHPGLTQTLGWADAWTSQPSV